MYHLWKKRTLFYWLYCSYFDRRLTKSGWKTQCRLYWSHFSVYQNQSSSWVYSCNILKLRIFSIFQVRFVENHWRFCVFMFLCGQWLFASYSMFEHPIGRNRRIDASIRILFETNARLHNWSGQDKHEELEDIFEIAERLWAWTGGRVN